MEMAAIGMMFGQNRVKGTQRGLLKEPLVDRLLLEGKDVVAAGCSRSALCIHLLQQFMSVVCQLELHKV